MKTPVIAATTVLASIVIGQSEVLKFRLSPPGTSPAVGLSPANEVPVVTNSTGSGGEVMNGITFETTNQTMNLAVGYGSAAGFTDLTGAATVMHIHGPASVTQSASVLINLGSLHMPAGDPTKGGVIFGSVVYPTNEVSNLLAGLNYLNIHTATNPGGEIRGQLIPVTNTPPTLVCPAATTRECTSSNGATVDLVARIFDRDGDALTVVWTVNGVVQQTNFIAASTNALTNEVHFGATFALGTHQVDISVSDSNAPPVTCSTTVTVVDTTPPEIRRVTATPNVLWPPNHKMVPVKIGVVAVDVCGPVTSKVVSVTSSEPVNGQGDGDTEPDWQITGPFAVNLRAERSGKGSGRVYTVTIESTDTAGNAARAAVTVTVLHDLRHRP